MTPKEFFDKVVEMRRCQKEYFKNKRQIDLRISKQIEREVDEESVATILLNICLLKWVGSSGIRGNMD